MATLAGCVASPTTILPTTPTGAGARACTPAPTGADVALDESADPAQAVSTYLDAGGDPETLAANLNALGWMTPGSAFVHADLDGDGDADIAVGLIESIEAEATAPNRASPRASSPGGDPEGGVPEGTALSRASHPEGGVPEGIGQRGNVVLWKCEAGSYQLSEIAPPRPDFGLPALVEAQDLTGDSLPELVVSYPVCGAHTCMAQYAVLQWDGASMANRFPEDTTDLPSPQWAVRSESPQGPLVIEITAQGIASVGAGPYRIWSRSYSWDPSRTRFVPSGEWIEPPRYRIHALHDADDDFRDGDLPAALALYERVIEDDSLLDWQATGDRRPELAAYAAYRRVLSFLVSEDEPSARAEMDLRLEGLSGPANAYAELAHLLLAADPARGLPQACGDVRRYVAENRETMLGPLDHGYANRTYLAADICPVS